MIGRALFSSAKDEWETPGDLFAVLDREFEFSLDPCATPDNAKCARFFTMGDDGLTRSWAGETVFVNPPYSGVAAWTAKAAQEAEGGAVVVLLIPARDASCSL